MKMAIEEWRCGALLALVLALAGCGGGGTATATTTTTTTTTTTVSGVAMAGPFLSGNVCAYRIANGGQGAQLACSAIDAATSGYSITFSGYTGDVLVAMEGSPAYDDEATTGDETSGTPFSGTLRSIVNISAEGSTVSVALTPLTEAAIRTANTLSRSAVESAAQQLATSFGLSGDLFATLPRKTPATGAEEAYRQALNALSHMQSGAGTQYRGKLGTYLDSFVTNAGSLQAAILAAIQANLPAQCSFSNNTIFCTVGGGTGGTTGGSTGGTTGNGGSPSGGGGASSGGGVAGLLGGAIQGSPLSLTTTVSTIAGTAGTGNAGFVDGTGGAAKFNNPFDVTTDGTNLYVVDQGNNRIRKIVIATGAVSTLAGPDDATCAANVVTLVPGVTSAKCPSGQTDGVGSAARFLFPYSITTDGTNLFVGDQQLIRKIVIATGAVTTLAGSTNGTADGIGTAAKFGAATAMTTDGTNLYVADQGFVNIRKVVIATGEVTTLAGSGLYPGNVDGVGTAVKFSSVLPGMTTDGTNIYIADYGNHTIRKMAIATGAVTTLPVTGAGFTAFTYPSGITTDGTSLFVTDNWTNTVYRIAIATNTVTTVAGGTRGRADGVGTAASFNGPRGIATDGTSLFVVDGTNNIIRQIH